MKKRILSLLIMLFMIVSIVLMATINNKPTESDVRPISISDILEPIGEIEIEPDPIEIAIQEMQTKMNNVESIEDKMEWFIAYKSIVLDPSETIYGYFTKEELDLLFRVVQAEVGDEWEFIHKANVASVIFNRLNSEEGDFAEQKTLSEVLVRRQFSTIRDESYKNVEVSEITILACEYAFMIEDTTDGCMAFRSDKNAPDKWCGWTKVFFDDAHYFYK